MDPCGHKYNVNNGSNKDMKTMKLRVQVIWGESTFPTGEAQVKARAGIIQGAAGVRGRMG